MSKEEIEVIIKPIFTKMFNADFSACEYGIECYKKGMEYQGIKELAIENDNLIKQVRILEQKIEKMKQDLDSAREDANRQEQWEIYSVLNDIYNDNFEVITSISN